MKNNLIALYVLVLASTQACLAAAPDWMEVPPSVDIKNIGTQKQLFLDDEIIETQRWITLRANKSAALLIETAKQSKTMFEAEAAKGTDVSMGIPGHMIRATEAIRRTQHTPTRHPNNPILRRDKPWEGVSEEHRFVFGPTVIYDEQENLWKMWYGSLGQLNRDLGAEAIKGLERWACYTMYATSKDGIHWEKPNLGITEFNGSTDNNIVLAKADQRHYFLYQIIKDPHDAEPGKWRYKAMIKTKPRQTVAVSLDGLHWKPTATFPRIGDETIRILHDREKSLYLMLARNRYTRPAWKILGNRTQRTFQSALSRDMIHWSYPRLAIVHDEHDQLDSEPIHIWPFCYEGMYIAIMGLRESTRVGGNINQNQLVYSRDGLRWHRMGERKPFMTAGPKGSWEDVSIEGFSVVVHNDEIRIYYTGNARCDPHVCRQIGLATLRLDGFVSLDSQDPDLGTFSETFGSYLLTKPLWSTGNRLVVNAEANGYINAELTDPDGRIIEGFSHKDCDTFKGDSLHHTFTWNGKSDIGNLLPVRIRFRMSDAKLYSLQIKDCKDKL